MKSFACSRRVQYINISMSESVKKKKVSCVCWDLKRIHYSKLVEPGQTLTLQGYTEHLALQNLEKKKNLFLDK